jgi:LPS-assembly lipoprotein
MRRALLPCLLALVLAACGWHPRGSQQTSLPMHELRLMAPNMEASLTVKLRCALEIAGVEIANAPASSLELHLGEEHQSSRKVSLDRDAHSAEQEMRVAVEFELRNAAGDVVFGPHTATAARIYAYDPNSIIAKQDEEALIHQELQDNVVGQIFRQLRRADAGTAP